MIAKSNNCGSSGSSSESSSSAGSLSGSVSGVLSLSSGLLPSSSIASLISAILTTSCPTHPSVTVTVRFTVIVCVGAIEAIMVSTFAPFATQLGSFNVRHDGKKSVTVTFSATTVPSLVTEIANTASSPGYTLSLCPSAKSLTKARSKISRSTDSKSASSSSPPVLSVISLTSVSLVSSLSGVLSISFGVSN